MKINDIEIEVERKPIKHIHLAVYPPHGRVHASVPVETDDSQLRFFILSKWVWLMEKIEKATSHTLQSPREFVSGEAHYFKGDLYRLRVDIMPNENQKVYIEGDYIVIRCRRRENAEELLTQWYRDNLKEILPPMVERWCERIGQSLPIYEVLAMPSSWGSCNHEKRKIMFNLQLAKKPLNCIEYVVAHECIHLIERNHTPRFFRILDTYLPNWETIKEQLNEMPV